jgi:hypothetical protein
MTLCCKAGQPVFCTQLRSNLLRIAQDQRKRVSSKQRMKGEISSRPWVPAEHNWQGSIHLDSSLTAADERKQNRMCLWAGLMELTIWYLKTGKVWFSNSFIWDSVCRARWRYSFARRRGNEEFPGKNILSFGDSQFTQWSCRSVTKSEPL